MKYLIVSVPANNPENKIETIVPGYLFKTYKRSLIKRLKTRTQIIIPLEEVKEVKTFVNFCRAMMPYELKKEISIRKAKLPNLDKLGVFEYARMLFDVKEEK